MNLIPYLAEHGIRARAISNNRLVVVGFVRLASGSVIAEATTIPATLRDVRDYLGY